jgi:hypothetical protein
VGDVLSQLWGLFSELLPTGAAVLLRSGEWGTLRKPLWRTSCAHPRSISSVVEHSLHTRGVTGSNPVSTTNESPCFTRGFRNFEVQRKRRATISCNKTRSNAAETPQNVHNQPQAHTLHNQAHSAQNRSQRRRHHRMELTQQHLGNLIHDHDGGAQLDPILAGLVLSPQELADLATLLLITANRIDYGDPGW